MPIPGDFYRLHFTTAGKPLYRNGQRLAHCQPNRWQIQTLQGRREENHFHANFNLYPLRRAHALGREAA